MAHDRTKATASAAKAEQAIAALAEAYPEVVEQNPWGHRAFKVKGKTFLFLGADADGLSFSLKLTKSAADAVMLPFAEPTGYGLGKSGWVTARFRTKLEMPMSLVAEWLDESYRAIAPRKVIAAMDAAKAAAPVKSSRKAVARTSR
jgi:predicted DNA-binding protein (MmcQ/YjbR family)